MVSMVVGELDGEKRSGERACLKVSTFLDEVRSNVIRWAGGVKNFVYIVHLERMAHTSIVWGESKRKLRAIKRALSMIIILTFLVTRWGTDSLKKQKKEMSDFHEVGKEFSISEGLRELEMWKIWMRAEVRSLRFLKWFQAITVLKLELWAVWNLGVWAGEDAVGTKDLTWSLKIWVGFDVLCNMLPWLCQRRWQIKLTNYTCKIALTLGSTGNRRHLRLLGKG